MSKYKSTLLLLLFSTLFMSCANEIDEIISPDYIDENISPDYTKMMSVSIDSEDFNISDIQDSRLISGNTNCNSIGIFTILENDSKLYRLNFHLLKNGELKKVEVWEISKELTGNIKLYLTPAFIPKSSFEITDFYYDTESNDISFGFNGTLYLENEKGTSDLKKLNGLIELESFQSKDCSMSYLQNIQYNQLEFQFNTIGSGRSKYTDKPSQDHTFASNNGYRLKLVSQKDLWNMEIGSYSFSSKTDENKILLSEYVGDLFATQLPLYKEEEWRALETLGSFTIDQKEQSGLDKNISGIINMIVSFNGETLFTISNMEYNTGSFE